MPAPSTDPNTAPNTPAQAVSKQATELGALLRQHAFLGGRDESPGKCFCGDNATPYWIEHCAHRAREVCKFLGLESVSRRCEVVAYALAGHEYRWATPRTPSACMCNEWDPDGDIRHAEHLAIAVLTNLAASFA